MTPHGPPLRGLRQAIADAVDVDDTSMYQDDAERRRDAVDTAQGGIDTATRRMNQMDALSSASTTLQAALAALPGATPTQALLDAANNALNALNTAITDGADLTDTEKAPYHREANNAAAPINTAQMAFDEAEDDAEKAEIAAMAVLATQLYAGINAPSTTAAAAYGTGDNAADIAVTIGTDAAVNLSEDEDATVADLDGWTGMMFTAEPDGDVGTYEARVYSHIGEATVTEGEAFNDTYTLDATTGETGDVTGLTGHVTSRVASPSFDQSAGTKSFIRARNDVRIHACWQLPRCVRHVLLHSYRPRRRLLGYRSRHGLHLAGGTWTFKPTNPASKLMDTSAADEIYASYGWWLHTSEDARPSPRARSMPTGVRTRVRSGLASCGDPPSTRAALQAITRSGVTPVARTTRPVHRRRRAQRHIR